MPIELRFFSQPGFLRRYAHLGFEWFHQQLNAELQKSEPLVWFVLLFMGGIAIYFNAPQEPSLGVLTALSIGVGLMVWRLRAAAVSFYVSASLFCVLAGFTLSAFHTFNDAE